MEGVDHALEALLADEEGDHEAFLFHRQAWQAEVVRMSVPEAIKGTNLRRFGVPYYVPVSER